MATVDRMQISSVQHLKEQAYRANRILISILRLNGDPVKEAAD